MKRESLLGLVAAGAFVLPAWPDVVVFQQGVNGYVGTIDTTVSQDVPDTALCDEPHFWVDGWMLGAGEEHGLLQFAGIFGTDSGQIPPGAGIQSAILRLEVVNPGSGFLLHRILTPWEECGTWNSWCAGVQADGEEAKFEYDYCIGTGTHGEIVPVGTLEIDVTIALRCWSAGSPNYGWVFRPWVGGSDAVYFWSSEGVVPPRLTVVFDAFGDCNQNGIDDQIELLRAFELTAPSFRDTGSYPTELTAAYLDSDGDIDVVVSNELSGTISVFWNNGAGEFPHRTDQSVGSHPGAVRAADLNLDGCIDLAVVNGHSHTVSVLIGDCAGGFAAPVDYPVGNLPVGLAIADLNGDCWPDLAVCSRVDDMVWILLNNGDGTFAVNGTWQVGDHPGSVVAADFDADGNLDLVVGNHYANSLSVLLNNGDATFAPKVDYHPVASPAGIVAADLDGDEDIDVAVACQSSVVSVLLNQGDGTFIRIDPDVPVGSYATGMTGADLDRDGDIDLATANYFGNSVTILLNNGDATFVRVDRPAGTRAYFVTSADFDGDGDDDLAVTDVLANKLAVLMTLTITADCNGNCRLDACDIGIEWGGFCTGPDCSTDWNGDGVPDECMPIALGDMNCDGVVDFDDIGPFVDALGGPEPYYAGFPECNWLNGDCNGDGVVTFEDINCFVALLAGGA